MITETVKPKSVEIPRDTLIAFRKLVKKYRYLSEFLRDYGFDRITTNRALKGETVSPDTLERIELLLNLKAA